MAKFNAATAVEAMDYDFTAFGGKAGTIPEPTSDQIQAFMKAIADTAASYRTLAKDTEAKVEDGMSDEEVIALVTADSDLQDKAKALGDNVSDAITAVTSGEITREDIDRLPWRIQQAFAAWLASELNPEHAGPATKR